MIRSETYSSVMDSKEFRHVYHRGQQQQQENNDNTEEEFENPLNSAGGNEGRNSNTPGRKILKQIFPHNSPS